MKFGTVSLLFSAALWAQTPPAPFQNLAAAPAAATKVPPGTVVAEIDGKQYTAAELDKMIESLPGAVQVQVRSNPKLALQQLFLFKALDGMAEKAGLDKQSPYKETLELSRMQYLANAYTNEYRNNLPVSPEEQHKYYDAHGDDFPRAKVRVIQIAFALPSVQPDPSKRTEADAKAKAEELRKKLAAGADFATLAKENSEDKTSAEKGGDFGTVTKNSSYPDGLKTAIFALKAGEVSEPIKQPNGYYLIRVDERDKQPFEEVNTQIIEKIRMDRFNDWMKALSNQMAVKVENENYFMPGPVAPLRQPPAQPSVPTSAK